MSVRHALLASLREGPKFGLQLRAEFEARAGAAWPLNVGQVYTTLQRLERDGFVEPDDEAAPGPRKRFRITARGADELARWLRTPPGPASPPRDELVVKILVAARSSDVDVHEVIAVHRRHLHELTTHWTRVAQGGPDLGLALVADAELYRLDATIRWLDAAEDRVRRTAPAAPAAPVPAAPAGRRRLRRAAPP